MEISLKRRPEGTWALSFHLDPCRTTTFALSDSQLIRVGELIERSGVRAACMLWRTYELKNEPAPALDPAIATQEYERRVKALHDQADDDARYGFRGVLNNLPPLMQSLLSAYVKPDAEFATETEPAPTGDFVELGPPYGGIKAFVPTVEAIAHAPEPAPEPPAETWRDRPAML